MKVLELLQEAFNSYYEVERDGPYSFIFGTESGNRYLISVPIEIYDAKILSDYVEPVVKEPLNATGNLTIMDVSFYLLSGESMNTKYDSDANLDVQLGEEDNVMKIFSTVIIIMKHAIQQKNPDIVTFEGTNKLARLYRTMTRRMSNENYELFISSGLDTDQFIFIRREILP